MHPVPQYGHVVRIFFIVRSSSHLPGPDWVGWHPSVDLEDIKLKVVENMGEDIHEYNLWPSRNRRLQNKGYINTEAISAIMEPDELTAWEMRSRVQELLAAHGVRDAEIFVRSNESFTQGSNVTITHEE